MVAGNMPIAAALRLPKFAEQRGRPERSLTSWYSRSWLRRGVKGSDLTHPWKGILGVDLRVGGFLARTPLASKQAGKRDRERGWWTFCYRPVPL